MTISGQSRKEARDLTKNSILSAKKSTTIGTWNVRTLYQTGKLEQLLREFESCNLEILGLSEMRWTGSGKEIHQGKTILYSGHSEHHVHGVGIVLNDQAAKALIAWQPVSERIITARIQSRHTKSTIVQVYAPTEEADHTDKDDFYEQLQDTLNRVPNHDVVILIGDLNAQIHRNREGLEHVIGPHGTARRTNDNGERFILLCSTNNLCIMNTFYQHRSVHKKTWKSPNGTIQNEIDYICMSKRWKTAVDDVRTFRGADIGSDHHLIKAKIRIKLKKVKHQDKIKPFALEKLKSKDVEDRYTLELSNRFQALEEQNDIEAHWDLFKQAVVTTAEQVIGRKRGSERERWIKDGTWDLIDQRKSCKNTLDQAKTRSQRETASTIYRALDRRVKYSCRADKNEWLENKGREAQEAANRNDSKTIYRIVRDLSGSKSSANAPIKDKNGRTLLTTEEQDARWVEHFKETLNQPTPRELYDFEGFPGVDELNVWDGEISIDEVSKAVKSLKNNKAAGLDQIPAELLKKGGSDLITSITKLVNKCWEEAYTPRDWRNGAISKIPKKGSTANCDNYRGLTLLSVPGKIICIVLLKRLQDTIDHILRDQQAGFRKGRSCAEQIFTLRNIIEQCIEFQKKSFLNFIDFRKAFDSIHRDSLWEILKTYGIPSKFINLFRNLYTDTSCCVKVESGYTEFFNIETGVRQGCILSPFLFLLAIDFVMSVSTRDLPNIGISWTRDARLCDLDFADDIALIAESSEDLQQLTDKLEENAAKVGLRINAGKTKSMQINCQTDMNLQLNGQSIEEVEYFTYLGSTIAADGNSERDINSRIGKASAVFQKLQCIWKRNSINTSLKMQIFKSIVIPTAIYASETWKSTARIIQKLDVFQQRCLRKILRVRYQDHITNVEILRRSNSVKLSEIITERRMRLAGHILRLPSDRITKTAMSWVPPGGSRRRGRPVRTWRSTFKCDLERVELTLNEAESVASDRIHWRRIAAQCAYERGRN